MHQEAAEEVGKENQRIKVFACHAEELYFNSVAQIRLIIRII